MRPFDFFFTFIMDRRTEQWAYFPIEMQFYISAMFVGFRDEMHEEKPSFLHASSHLYNRACPSVGRSVGNAFFLIAKMTVFLHVCHQGGPGISQKCRIASL